VVLARKFRRAKKRTPAPPLSTAELFAANTPIFENKFAEFITSPGYTSRFRSWFARFGIDEEIPLEDHPVTDPRFAHIYIHSLLGLAGMVAAGAGGLPSEWVSLKQFLNHQGMPEHVQKRGKELCALLNKSMPVVVPVDLLGTLTTPELGVPSPEGFHQELNFPYDQMFETTLYVFTPRERMTEEATWPSWCFDVVAWPDAETLKQRELTEEETLSVSKVRDTLGWSPCGDDLIKYGGRIHVSPRGLLAHESGELWMAVEVIGEPSPLSPMRGLYDRGSLEDTNAMTWALVRDPRSVTPWRTSLATRAEAFVRRCDELNRAATVMIEASGRHHRVYHSHAQAAKPDHPPMSHVPARGYVRYIHPTTRIDVQRPSGDPAWTLNHRVHVRGHLRLYHRTGPLPLSDERQKRMRVDGYKFWEDGVEDDEVKHYCALRARPTHTPDGKWLATKLTFVDDHYRGPEGAEAVEPMCVFQK